jgi:hypothetical protein
MTQLITGSIELPKYTDKKPQGYNITKRSSVSHKNLQHIILPDGEMAKLI